MSSMLDNDRNAGKIDRTIDQRGDFYVGDHVGNVLWSVVTLRIGPGIIEGFRADDPKAAYLRMHDGSGGWISLQGEGFYRIDAVDVEAYIRLEDARVATMKTMAASVSARPRINAPGAPSGLPS